VVSRIREVCPIRRQGAARINIDPLLGRSEASEFARFGRIDEWHVGMSQHFPAKVFANPARRPFRNEWRHVLFST
jgi:hypothetical protein